MSRRTDPHYRTPDEELDGVAGCLAFGFFLIVETAVAGMAGFLGYYLARSAPLDVGHEVGVVLSILGGIAALLWIDHHCRRLTGHSAGEIACEFLFAWW